MDYKYQWMDETETTLMRFDASCETCPDYDNQKVLFIPADEYNRHYQEYLQWVQEGNEALPADSV